MQRQQIARQKSKKTFFYLTLPGILGMLIFDCAPVSPVRQTRPPVARVDRPNKPAPPPQENQQHSFTPLQMEYGKASFIADSYEGKATASGDYYDRKALTAAHLTLPFGTLCQVTNLANGRTVQVRVNDRFAGTLGRVILLSRRAAEILQMVPAGVINAKLEVVRYPEGAHQRR